LNLDLRQLSDSSRNVVSNDSEPPPAPKPLLKPVSGGVLNGKAISLPAPTYPELARRMRTGGKVEVEVIVDENGKVISAHASSGPTALRDVAVEAAMRARFTPTKLSGQPVKIAGRIDYNFTLP
jgi:TonB family protein